MSEQADKEGRGESYREQVVDELLELDPDVRSTLVGRWMDEVCEEVTRRSPSTESHSIVMLLQNIENDWRNQS